MKNSGQLHSSKPSKESFGFFSILTFIKNLKLDILLQTKIVMAIDADNKNQQPNP